MSARLWIISVLVKYTHPDFPGESAAQIWYPRVVAFDEHSAQKAGMVWAERQVPFGVALGSKAFAQEASTVLSLVGVECIAENVVKGQ